MRGNLNKSSFSLDEHGGCRITSRLNFSLPEVESRTQGSIEAKDTKKIRGQGQGQPFRGDTLEAKDQGHKRKSSPKKKGLHKNFSGDLQKKGLTKIFQAISTKKRFPKYFLSAPQNFNISKNSAVLEPRTGQFSRT